MRPLRVCLLYTSTRGSSSPGRNRMNVANRDLLRARLTVGVRRVCRGKSLTPPPGGPRSLLIGRCTSSADEHASQQQSRRIRLTCTSPIVHEEMTSTSNGLNPLDRRHNPGHLLVALWQPSSKVKPFLSNSDPDSRTTEQEKKHCLFSSFPPFLNEMDRPCDSK